MNAKEKAPTREATRAEAAETAAFGRAAISIPILSQRHLIVNRAIERAAELL